ncbi:MAG: hypothetical protein ACW979_02145 [Candidatus Thorarchaeota archaeon]|jgi:hypothetical protein
MRRVLVLCTTFLLVTSILNGHVVTEPQTREATVISQGSISIERDWAANIIVVGYDPALIDEVLLLSGMPSIRDYSAGDVDIRYNIEYQIDYADSTFVNSLRREMLDNSINGTGTGTRLNESALSYQKANLDDPQRIFYPRSGRVIDGYAIEDWLEENPYVTPPSLGYTLYLVNFSEFDNSDHSLEHWYDYHPVDPDTGEEQDWFRLEWDNALNPNVTMDYSFFGGRTNTFLVDPSAHQWYLKWCRIWWSQTIGTEYDFWTQDLEDKTGSLNLAVPADVDALNVYLQECLWDPINQLFFPYQHQPASFVDSGTLKALVFCMDVANGTSVESLEWVTDAEMQQAHLEELYPFIPWTVDVEYLDIDDEPVWNATFWMHSWVEDGITHSNGSELFSEIRSSLRPSYVVDDGNINVFGVVFIKKQMMMHTHGGIFTGLGGPGQTVIWKSWERYYRPDGVTPKDGVSSVQLHETMHAIGFGHSFVHGHYSSDFTNGPMGYFAFHNGTSTFDKNWVQGTYLDQMEAILWYDFLVEQVDLRIDERPETYIAEDAAMAAFDSARQYYNEMNWLAAYEFLETARDWTKRMMYSTLDDTPPIIDNWGTIPVEIGSGSFIYWAHVLDDLAGLENVTLYAQVDEGDIQAFPLSYGGGNWSVLVPSPGHSSNLTLWVVAWDWGMNIAKGGNLTYLISQEPTIPDFLVSLIVATSAAAVVIVLGVYVMKRRE